ncbi:hypothetical protein SLA2020_106460 [Shorea laevis]
MKKKIENRAKKMMQKPNCKQLVYDFTHLMKLLKCWSEEPPSWMLFMVFSFSSRVLISQQFLYFVLNLFPSDNPTFIFLGFQSPLPNITNVALIQELIREVGPAKEGTPLLSHFMVEFQL